MNDYKNELAKNEPKLASLLASRIVPEPSDDLQRRIARAAQQHPQRMQATFRDVIGHLVAEYLSPKPAIAFASLLLVGFVFGFAAPYLSDTVPTIETNNFAAILYMDGSLL